MKTYRYVFASTAMALLVSGCGGGGGSSAANNSGPTIPTAAVQITTQNSAAVAKGGNSSAAGIAGTGSGTATMVGVMVVSGTHRSVRDIALSEFNRALSLPLPKQTVVGVTSTQGFSINCTTNQAAAPGSANSLSYSFTQATPGATSLAAGDSMTIAYYSCTSGGFTTNGSLQFLIASLTGTRATASVGSQFSAGFTLKFNNLTDLTVASGDTSNINGDITISTTSNGTTVSDTISGTSLSTSSTIGGVADYALITANPASVNFPTTYNINYTETLATTAYSYSVDMKVASTGMNGSVGIATPTAFSAPIASSFPTAGVMMITGANGGSIQLTALNATSVQMIVTPSTPPGGAPVTSTVPWTQL